MRVCGVLIIGFCVSLIGFYITSRLISKSNQLRKIIRFIDFFEQKIKYSKETVKSIIDLFVKDKDFSFLLSESKVYDVDYFERICFDNNALYIDDEEKNLLYVFLCGLGKTNLDGQIAHCEIYKANFESALEKYEQENRNKIKLYPSLFILIGMLVVLIFF